MESTARILAFSPMRDSQLLKKYIDILKNNHLPLNPEELNTTLTTYKDYFRKFISLDEMADKFLETVKMEQSENTCNNYEQHLKQFAKNQTSFDEDNVRAFIKSEQEKGNSNASINTKLSALRSFAKWARIRGYIPINFMEAVKSLPVTKKVSNPIEIDVESVFQNIEAQYKETGLIIRTKTLFLLFMLLGCRVSEFLNITLENIDLKNQQIKLEKGKGNKERFCYYSNEYAPYIEAYLEYRKGLNTDCEYLFLNYKHKQLSRNGIYKIISKHTEAIGNKLGCHDLRRWCAQTMILKNIPITTVQQILGHERLDTTIIYTGNNEQLKKDAVAQMTGIYGGGI